MIRAQEPIETAELLAFVHTVDAKSLSRAAAELRLPRATVGRRLARLEQRLGTRLLRRTTRTLALTDAGDRFYRHARGVLDALGQAEACVRTSDGVMRGELRVSVPPNLDASFSELVTAFVKAHPNVRLSVDASTRLVDLQREGYDVALRASPKLEPGLYARTLARPRMIAVASPAYLAEMGTPRTARDLERHRCLTGFARGELPQSTWPAGRGTVRVEGAFTSNDLGLLRDAALAGLGVALLPELLLREALESGALVQVLAGSVETESRLAVVYVERELLAPQVRAFVEAIVAWAPVLTQRTVKKLTRGARR
jgi:DNA-binding transcriptional LysR family regulator